MGGLCAPDLQRRKSGWQYTMSLKRGNFSRSSSDEDLLSRSGRGDGAMDSYEPIQAESLEDDLQELDVDGNPIYHDEDDTFDYPDMEKQFGEVVVVLKHLQKCTPSSNAQFLLLQRSSAPCSFSSLF